jgi:hypothetical protein
MRGYYQTDYLKGIAYLFEDRFEDFYKKYGKYSSYEKKLLLRK